MDFLRSVAGAFGGDRAGSRGVLVAVLVLLVVALALALSSTVRRLRARTARLSRLTARHGLARRDLDLARTLAAAEGVTPDELLSRLDAFERATARALASRSPPAFGEDDAADRILRLRRLLGFDRLPAHAPLLTSRELAPGTGVAVEGVPGQVAKVDELGLTVELSGAPAGAGPSATLDLVHAREARYRLRCPVLARTQSAGGTSLVLGHDESPERVQQRAFARTASSAEIGLRPFETWPAVPRLRSTTARLVDLSAGGALVAAPFPLPVGALLSASFTLGNDRFAGIRAVVLSNDREREAHRAHLEFGPMSEHERDRLIAAVERAARAAA